jgi:uridine nucleosidase
LCARIPLNITHLAVVTPSILVRVHSAADGDPTSSKPRTNLRHTLSTLINFFADSYRSTFGFASPPLHDALAVMYVSRPDLFTTRRFRVDVELSGAYTAGETVVDVWNYRKTDDSWGSSGKNCAVAQSLDVSVIFTLVAHRRILTLPHRFLLSSTFY